MARSSNDRGAFVFNGDKLFHISKQEPNPRQVAHWPTREGGVEVQNVALDSDDLFAVVVIQDQDPAEPARQELWHSDGTPDGTRALVRFGGQHGRPFELKMVACGDELFLMREVQEARRTRHELIRMSPSAKEPTVVFVAPPALCAATWSSRVRSCSSSRPRG